jgi:mono/diheme cytochrome c family protein
VIEKKEMIGLNESNGVNPEIYAKGKEIFNKDGYCGTCHRPNGEGMVNSGFPPLIKTRFVLGNDEDLIRIVLKGLQGPMEVNGRKYDGQVPMTPFEGLLNDEDVAAVLTYVRNSFGNKASVVTPAKVKMVREKIKDKKGFYHPDELSAN